MKTFTFLTLLVFLFSVPAVSQDKSKLLPIKKIYIGELVSQKQSSVKGSLVREKIRLHLMKTDRFVVVESSEAADAVLTGIVWMPSEQLGNPDSNPLARSVYDTDPLIFGKGALRLVDAKTNETIWLYEYQRALNVKRAGDRIADKVVDELIKDAKETSKVKAKKK